MIIVSLLGLTRYDVTFARLKEAIRDKDKEISELKISISEVEARKRLQSSRAADIDASYQVRAITSSSVL